MWRARSSGANGLRQWVSRLTSSSSNKRSSLLVLAGSVAASVAVTGTAVGWLVPRHYKNKHNRQLDACLAEVRQTLKQLPTQNPAVFANPYALATVRKFQADKVTDCLAGQNLAAVSWLWMCVPQAYLSLLAADESKRIAAVCVVATNDNDHGNAIRRALAQVHDIAAERLPHFAQERFSDLFRNAPAAAHAHITSLKDTMCGNWMRLRTGKPTRAQVYHAVVVLASSQHVDGASIRAALGFAGPDLVQTPNYEAARCAMRRPDQSWKELEQKIAACLLHVPRPRSSDAGAAGVVGQWTCHVSFAQPLVTLPGELGHSSKAAHDEFWLQVMQRDLLERVLLSRHLSFGDLSSDVMVSLPASGRIPPQAWIADRQRQARAHKLVGIDVTFERIVGELYRRAELQKQAQA